MMTVLRILVANHPLIYRQAHADALRELRPEAEVRLADPRALDAEIARFAPHLAICSELSALVRSLLAWLLLYPDGANLAVACVEGRETTIPNVGFDDVLRVVDETMRRMSAAPNAGAAADPSESDGTLGRDA
jgi:hypothetical protein